MAFIGRRIVAPAERKRLLVESGCFPIAAHQLVDAADILKRICTPQAQRLLQVLARLGILTLVAQRHAQVVFGSRLNALIAELFGKA